MTFTLRLNYMTFTLIVIRLYDLHFGIGLYDLQLGIGLYDLHFETGLYDLHLWIALHHLYHLTGVYQFNRAMSGRISFQKSQVIICTSSSLPGFWTKCIFQQVVGHFLLPWLQSLSTTDSHSLKKKTGLQSYIKAYLQTFYFLPLL